MSKLLYKIAVNLTGLLSYNILYNFCEDVKKG